MKNKKIMYGLIAIISLLVWVTVFLSAVFVLEHKQGGKSNNKNNIKQSENIEKTIQVVNEKTEENNEINVNDFAKKINGYWTYKADGNTTHDVLYSYDNYLITWVEEGGIDREGEIKKVVQRTDGCYELTVYYPETIHYDELMKAEESIWIIKSVDKVKGELIFISGENKTTYKFAGNTEEEYIEFCNDARIPILNIRAEELDRDLEALKIRTERMTNLSMVPWFLQNLDGVISYCFSTGLYTTLYFGEKDGKIVYSNSYKDTRRYNSIKNFLPDNALTTPPAVYVVDPEPGSKFPLPAYVWKIDNGYMIIITFDGGGEFYDNKIGSVYYVTDLKYLSFIK